MTDPITLAARVEALTGPCRETDCLVWAAREGIKLTWQGTTLVAGIEGVIGWIDPGEHSRNFGCSRIATGPGCIPAYTASLDAAMTLVPEGWRIWTADFSVLHRTRWMLEGPKTKWAVDNEGFQVAGDDWFVQAIAATPALALLAAALRARVTQ